MHFKTTEPGATAYICTDKNLCGDGTGNGKDRETKADRKGKRFDVKRELQ